jgi:uroporphyrin-III C-methyltransferase / precorrin-2 dehydrogenase / sirohydrochlorin ferrochelatase
MYFPLFLNIKNSKFLIIGAGNIALAKLETILEFSSNVQILAPQISAQIAEKNVEIIKDIYDKKYLLDYDIIIAATDNHAVNEQISQDAKSLNKLVNVVDDAENSLFIFGANVKRGEIILSAGTSGVSPVLARLLKQKLQNILPENFAILNDFLIKNRDLAKAKLTEIQARRLFWQEVLEGVIGQEVLSGNILKAQNLLEEKLKNLANKKEAAVYFISAGPGDPELFTLKGIKLLSKADVVLYDRLVSPEILAHARRDALKINVGKTRDLHRYRQEEINELIRKYVLDGNIVARLKGGDAGIFGRLGEEIEAISDLKIPYQIVPGITAASGAAAYAGIPLTSRNTNKSIRFLTIYQDDLVDEDYWRELAKSKDSLVLYMSSHNLITIVERLMAAGKNPKTPFAVIEQATTPFQKTFTSTLENFQDRKFISPSLVIIGDVVNNRYDWREEVLSGNYFQKLEERNEQ